MKYASLVRWTALSVLWGVLLIVASAQNQAAVPDLTGESVPRAAALLNKAGFALGREITVPLTGEATANTISGQSVAPGAMAAVGTVIDVEIPRNANVRLIYDDNDLTLINLDAAGLNIEHLSFEAVGAAQPTEFRASRWNRQLRTGQCLQIWSVNRNGPKDLPDCDLIQNWLTTGNRAEHFWMTGSGAQTFAVIQDGLERAVCDAAPANSQDRPLSCEFYLPAGTQSDTTEFIYVAYRTDALAVINKSEVHWMPINTPSFRPVNSSADPFDRAFKINAGLFGRPEIVARINRLAPNQCVLFVAEGAAPAGLQDCDVIATYTVSAQQVWWAGGYQIIGSDSTARDCAAPVQDRLTVCIMPR